MESRKSIFERGVPMSPAKSGGNLKNIRRIDESEKWLRAFFNYYKFINKREYLLKNIFHLSIINDAVNNYFMTMI